MASMDHPLDTSVATPLGATTTCSAASTTSRPTGSPATRSPSSSRPSGSWQWRIGACSGGPSVTWPRRPVSGSSSTSAPACRPPTTHEVAQRIAPESRILYVDNDPLVLVHARALLTSSPEGRTDYVNADLNDPQAILRRPALREDPRPR